MIYKKEESG